MHKNKLNVLREGSSEKFKNITFRSHFLGKDNTNHNRYFLFHKFLYFNDWQIFINPTKRLFPVLLSFANRETNIANIDYVALAAFAGYSSTSEIKKGLDQLISLGIIEKISGKFTNNKKERNSYRIIKYTPYDKNKKSDPDKVKFPSWLIDAGSWAISKSIERELLIYFISTGRDFIDVYKITDHIYNYKYFSSRKIKQYYNYILKNKNICRNTPFFSHGGKILFLTNMQHNTNYFTTEETENYFIFFNEELRRFCLNKKIPIFII